MLTLHIRPATLLDVMVPFNCSFWEERADRKTLMDRIHGQAGPKSTVHAMEATLSASIMSAYFLVPWLLPPP
jgi:hypothetical protein